MTDRVPASPAASPSQPSGAGERRFRILCDFDGTITNEDVTDLLLETFALPQWQEIEARWKAGEIGSRECMGRQVELLRASQEELNRCLDTVEIDPGFPAFVARAARLGLPLVVVSDGIDYAIHRILARHSLSHLPVYANRLHLPGDGRYSLSFPYAGPPAGPGSCRRQAGTCKCRIAAAALPGQPVETLLIGDGTSDFCAAGSVTLVLARDALARDSLLSWCRQQGLPHLPFTGFAEATGLLDGLSRTGLSRTGLSQTGPALAGHSRPFLPETLAR